MGRSVPRNIDETRTIPLTRGLVALVDAAGYEWLSQWKWLAHRSVSHHFYAARGAWDPVRKRRHTVYMHRVLLATAGEVDHINGDKLDNRRSNLRAVTRLENTQNQRNKRSGCSAEGIGIYRRPNGRWTAQVTVNYRNIALGTFDTHEEAMAARAAGVVRFYGGAVVSLGA
jgi:hypothetical protein